MAIFFSLSVFHQNFLFICFNYTCYRFYEVKIYPISCYMKNTLICKKSSSFWRLLWNFGPHNFTRILGYRELCPNPKPTNEYDYSHTNFQENRIKTGSVTVPLFFFDKKGECDVINCVYELKLKHTQLDIISTICGKLYFAISQVLSAF